MRVLEIGEIEAFSVGASILGGGGGGESSWGEALVRAVASRGREMRLADLSELPDGGTIFIVSAVGGGVSEEVRRGGAATLDPPDPGRLYLEPAIAAISGLACYLGRQPVALLPAELGSGNMLLPLAAAASLGIPLVDGDACGRAKPEISVSTTRLAGLSIVPLALATPLGELALVVRAEEEDRAERLVRQLAVFAGGSCVVARCPAPVGAYRSASIPGTFSLALRLGRSVLAASDRDGLAKAVLETLPGSRLLCVGRIDRWSIESSGGFLTGTLTVAGGRPKHSIWFKNEYLVVTQGKRLVASCPDLVLVVNATSRRGLSNWDEDPGGSRGAEVLVFQVPSHRLWRTPRGLELFGPRHFGIDADPVLIPLPRMPERG